MSVVNRRHCCRIKTGYQVVYSSGRDDGDGFLTNISDSGALMEEVSFQPRIGNRVRLLVCLSDQVEFELVGQVARHTEGGFSVEFEKHYPILHHLIRATASTKAGNVN